MFLSSSTIILIKAEEIATAVLDRDIIDLIKENILQDKKREDEYVRLLKDYISFLKEEMSTKNNIIYKHLHIFHQKDIYDRNRVISRKRYVNFKCHNK